MQSSRHQAENSSRYDSDVAPATGFLETLRIDHGPLPLLGRFFAAGDMALADKGISLTRGSLADALDTQMGNEASWHSFPPMLDVRLSGVGVDESYCLLGRDASGEVVTVQCGRIYQGTQSLAAWVESGRFVYGSRPVGADFQFKIASPSVQTIGGTFVYSGALWVHPRHRGSKLAGVLVRLSRAYALARWNTSYTIAFVSDAMADSPMPAIYGYRQLEPGVRVNLADGATWSGLLMWMGRDELLSDLTSFLVDRLPQVDAGVVHRSTNQEL